MKQQQGDFQRDGPYRSYYMRHLELRRETNRMLCLLVFPAVLYLLTGSGLCISAGAVLLPGVLYLSRLRSNKLLDEYTVMEQSRLTELEQVLTEMGIPPPRSYTLAYRKTTQDFTPVLLCASGDSLYLLENVFVKNCIYGIEGQMLYLFDLVPDILQKGFKQYSAKSMVWRTCGDSHQQLLRSEGLRLNNFLVVESFIYGAVLAEMQTGKRKQLLHTTYLLTKMRKEKMYETDLDEGGTLLLPQDNVTSVGLPVNVPPEGGCHNEN